MNRIFDAKCDEFQKSAEYYPGNSLNLSKFKNDIKSLQFSKIIFDHLHKGEIPIYQNQKADTFSPNGIVPAIQYPARNQMSPVFLYANQDAIDALSQALINLGKDCCSTQVLIIAYYDNSSFGVFITEKAEKDE